MPKKLKFEKTYQDAVCKIYKNTYRVVSFWDNNNKEQWLKYYQIQKNRKKIANTRNLEVAIRRMIAEAQYELQDIFNK